MVYTVGILYVRKRLGGIAMSGFVQPDKEAEKAFRKMVKECSELMNEDDLPYVKATSEEVENFFETMTPKQKKFKKKVEDLMIMY